MAQGMVNTFADQDYIELSLPVFSSVSYVGAVHVSLTAFSSKYV